MKTIISYGIIFGLLTILGCSKDDIDENNNTDDTYYVRAKVGEYLKTLNAFPITSNINNEYVTLRGYKDEVGITLRVPDSIGTYDFESNNFTGKLTFGPLISWCDWNNNCDDPSVDYNVFQGSVTITSTDNNGIKGTFDFLGETENDNTFRVSEGEFNCKKE